MIPPKIKTSIISIAILISMVSGFLYRPPQAQAFAAITFSPKEFWEQVKAHAEKLYKDRVRIASRVAMRVLAAEIRKQLINNGGKPTFVTNWRNYQRRSQDTGSIIARQLIGESARGIDDDPATAVMCDFLRDPINSQFRGKRVSQEFADIARAFRIDSNSTYKMLTKCTLPTTLIVDGVEKPFDVDVWRKDFSQGGWSIWEMMLRDENNYVGVARLTEAEIAKQKKAQELSAMNDAIAGNGFLSLTNPNGQIKTPGKILQDSASNLIDMELRCLETADTWGLFFKCATNILDKQLKNFRNIADDVGLLDDEQSDNGEDGDPEAVPQDFRAMCTNINAETAAQYCVPATLTNIDDADGNPIETEADLSSALSDVARRINGCGNVEFCREPLIRKRDELNKAQYAITQCKQKQEVQLASEFEGCSASIPPETP